MTVPKNHTGGGEPGYVFPPAKPIDAYCACKEPVLNSGDDYNKPGTVCIMCNRHLVPSAIIKNAGQQWIRDAKKYEGKPHVAEVFDGFALAFEAIVQVSMYGYGKHTVPARAKLVAEGKTEAEAMLIITFNNWQNGDILTYRNAAERHRLALSLGEEIASDSKLPHRWHLAWNECAIIVLERKSRG